MQPKSNKLTMLAILAALAASTGAASGWITAKATVAQMLLDRAWQLSLDSDSNHKAWSWADTFPVARLTIPELNKSIIVLEGASGESMAFGPGRISESALTTKRGVFAIGGHRDTHLSFLKDIQSNQSVSLQTRDGSTTLYRVTEQFMVDTRKTVLSINTERRGLVMITCYPFNAAQTGGPLRWVVVATPIEVI